MALPTNLPHLRPFEASTSTRAAELVEPLEALGGLVIQPAWRPLEAPFLKTLESNTAGKSSMILYANDISRNGLVSSSFRAMMPCLIPRGYYLKQVLEPRRLRTWWTNEKLLRRCCQWFSHVVTTCREKQASNASECMWMLLKLLNVVRLTLLVLQLDSLLVELSLSIHRMFQLTTPYPTCTVYGFWDILTSVTSLSWGPVQNMLNTPLITLTSNSTSTQSSGQYGRL